MYIGAMGDLAQSYAMQARNTAIKQDIQRLTLELSSGQVADLRDAIGGNTAYVNDLERSLVKLDGYDLATQEASQFAQGVQMTLSQIHDLNIAFRDTLLVSANSALGETSNSILTQAKSTLSDIISAMNTTVGGRALFGGVATDTQSIAPPEDILTALGASMTGAGTVDDMLAAAEAWFNDPSGYGSIGYLGSATSLAPMSLSDGETAQFDLRGDNQVFRDTLRNLAVVAVADDPALGLTTAQQSELFQKTTNGVFSSISAVTDLQATVGFSESRIETISVRNNAERSSLELARNDLLAIDPYQTATELEQVQFQLQSLYAITSRMSQLSLVNYL